jgi:hypothetical protein
MAESKNITFLNPIGKFITILLNCYFIIFEYEIYFFRTYMFNLNSNSCMRV